ncbi:MAG: hypothetical protein IPK06_18550 [Ignavibacteriae bacterium]|nr:hypothetical protein [Ignavibacteriota bacterium]
MAKYLAFFVFVLFLSSNVFTQSDFRITQEFKSRQRSFEIAIEYAKTPDELDQIEKEIEEFKSEFKGNKELLNRALYPSNFDASFKTLESKIDYSRKKVDEISNLNTQVTTLQTNFEQVSDELAKLTEEINALRNTNVKLMSELRSMKSGFGKTKAKIDSLNKVIFGLRQGIAQRDTLIKEIMDNIFMSAEHKLESLDDAELKGIKTKLKSTGLIDNISNLVSDNIDFLNASVLTSDDLNVLKNEYGQFQDRWQHFGPKLFSIYSADPENKDKLAQIDTQIVNWNKSIDKAVFRAIHEEFKTNNINMPFFSNGKEFESTIIAYIERKIDNANKLGVNDDNEFIFFSENVWNDIIKTKWATILLNNNLVSKEQLNNIDKKIDEWKHSLGGSKSIFIYGIIVLLALIILVTVYIIYKKNKKLDEINQLNEIKVEIPKKNNDEKSVQDVYDDLADNFEDDIDDENNLDKK